MKNGLASAALAIGISLLLFSLPASAQQSGSSQLVTTYFVGTVTSLSGTFLGFFGSPVGSTITGSFTVDLATLGTPPGTPTYTNGYTANTWVQQSGLFPPYPANPSVLPSNNSGVINFYGQGGTTFAARTLGEMMLAVSEDQFSFGTGQPNQASLQLECNPLTPLPITAANRFPFPSTIPSGCFATANIDAYSNDPAAQGQGMIVSITQMSGSPANCPAMTFTTAVSNGIFIEASASPASGTLVTTYATHCGFDALDWQQQITHKPLVHGNKPWSPLYVRSNIIEIGDTYPTDPSACLIPGPEWPSTCNVYAGTQIATLSSPNPVPIAPAIFDPPPGGDFNSNTKIDPTTGITTIVGPNQENNSYPFYYPSQEWPGGFFMYCVSVQHPDDCPGKYRFVIDQFGTRMNYADRPFASVYSGCPSSSTPQNGCADTPGPTNQYASFTTYLMGLTIQQVPSSIPCAPDYDEYGFGQPYYCKILHSFTWNSTAKNQSGGTTVGGVTITGIDGVTLPPSVLASDLSVTSSGLNYSRVTQSFTGTVTLKNTSSATITGPLQIVMFGLPAAVNLINQTSNLSGTPYLTVPNTNGLEPGASVSISIQISNPTNAALNLQPTVYAGTI